jgi:multidrug efflux pump subunit AcrA (membrane-fusion protein)
VALQGTATNNVVQYPVTVRLSSVPDGVRLGASANVTITTASRDGVLTVPTSAITTTGTGATVTVLRDGRQTTVDVTKGLSGGSTTEVTGDIAEGDQVVLPSGSRPSAGVPGAGVARFGGFSGGVR